MTSPSTELFDLAFAWSVLPELLRALGVTVVATVAGMALALPLGLVFTLARRSRWRIVAGAAAFVVDFVRSTPLLIQIYFLFYVLPQVGPSLSPLATGILALGLHYSSYTSEVYRAGIEAVPRGQWEAARSLGFRSARLWRRVILPQALPPVIPALGNYLVAMFKDSPMLAAITVAELLQTAKVLGAESFRYLETLTLVGLLFLAVSLASARGIRFLETRYAVRHT